MAAGGQEMATASAPGSNRRARTCQERPGNAGVSHRKREMMADDSWVPRGEPDGLGPAVPLLADRPLPRSDGCLRPGDTCWRRYDGATAVVNRPGGQRCG